MLFFARSKAMVSRGHVERGGKCRAPPEANQEEWVMSHSFLSSPEVTASPASSSWSQFREFRKEYES
jgi:hypothetical protein